MDMLFTNEELIFIYLRQKRFLEIHEDVLQDAKNDAIRGLLEIDMTKYNQLKNSPHILMLKDINNKLEPIIELIRESMPDEYSEVEALVDNPLNESDDE
jgi:hypothetical protein